METFSDFLIPLKFTLDEPSKKKFDAAIGEVEKKFAAIGAAAGAAAVALGFAVKEISKNLANLAYSAERVGASSEELKALGNAADRIGIGAEAAKSSLTEFFAFVNFQGGASAIKQWFNIDFDPFHPLKGWLDSAVKLADEYASGSVPRRQTAIREAERAGINQSLLTTPGAARRLREEVEKDKAFTGGALNPIAENAKRLNADFEKVVQHLKTIRDLASGPLQDAFSDLLETVDGWLAAHKDTIIWFSNKAAEISVMIVDKGKEISTIYQLGTAELWKQLDITQKIDAALKGIGETLKSFWDGSITGKIHAALEWAFQPFKWLWDKLWNLGLVPGSAGGGGVDGSGGGGFSRGGATESGGHGAARRGAFGHGGARGSGGEGSGGKPRSDSGGAIPASGPSGSVYSMIDRAAGGDKHVSDDMKAIFEGESDHARGVFDVGDHRTAFGPFQMNIAGGRLGAQFQAETGIDPRNPNNQQAVADWVARYLKKRYAANPNFNPGTVWFGYPHGRERIRRGQVHPNDTVMNTPAGMAPSARTPARASDFHKAIESIRAAKPLAPWEQSMNQTHDHRIVNSNVEVKVAGAYPIDKTARPLERTKNASIIRNTTATAA